jgi:hypothetical protein
VSDLIHLHEVDGVFYDRSINQNNLFVYPTDFLLADNCFVYVGLYKPFQNVYVEIKDKNISKDKIIVEYWNGDQWVDLPSIEDNTENLTKSGFISWRFENESKITDQWLPETINGITKHFIRFSGVTNGVLLSEAQTGTLDDVIVITDSDISKFKIGDSVLIEQSLGSNYYMIADIDTTSLDKTITLDQIPTNPILDGDKIYTVMSTMGINIVYADDIDLEMEVRTIKDYLHVGDKSFIPYHVSARNFIVQSLRNGGNFKGKIGLKSENVTKWDVLDFGEIREAAKYLALANIFFDVSENNEDKSYQRYRDYKNSYGEAFKVYRMKLDLNDDGNIDSQDEILNNISIHKI